MRGWIWRSKLVLQETVLIALIAAVVMPNNWINAIVINADKVFSWVSSTTLWAIKSKHSLRDVATWNDNVVQWSSIACRDRTCAGRGVSRPRGGWWRRGRHLVAAAGCSRRRRDRTVVLSVPLPLQAGGRTITLACAQTAQWRSRRWATRLRHTTTTNESTNITKYDLMIYTCSKARILNLTYRTMILVLYHITNVCPVVDTKMTLCDDRYHTGLVIERHADVSGIKLLTGDDCRSRQIFRCTCTGYMYSTRHLLCIKPPLKHKQFWCTINDEYCI